MKLDLLTNATVVDDAIRFVNEKSSSNLGTSNRDIQTDERQEAVTNKVF